MGKIFISPAVVTNEVDKSYLPAAVGQIGAAFVGKAPFGPAFVPYKCDTYTEASQIFGDLSAAYPMTYGIRAYMRNAPQATIVRVLGPNGRAVNGAPVVPGYTADSMVAITSVSASKGYVHALIEVTGSQTLTVNNLTNDLFDLRIGSGSTYSVAVTASLLTSSGNYIGKILNTDSTKYGATGHWLRGVYDYVTPSLYNGTSTFSAATIPQTNFQIGYRPAYTPWATSQEFGGGVDWNLFRFHTVGHGEAENGRFKVSISNITPSPSPTVQPYGKFDVQIRLFKDTDRQPVLVETFPNCDLDPSSTNYLPLRIGTRYYDYDATKNKLTSFGDFPNVSKFVRVEMSTGSPPAECLPWGFRGLAKPLVAVSGTTSAIPDMPYVPNLKDKETQAEVQPYIYWGMETQISGAIDARLKLMPSLGDSDADFSLKNVSGSIEGALTYVKGNTNKKFPGNSLASTTLDAAHARFTMPLAFAFDGWDYRIVDPVQNETQCLTPAQLGSQAIRQGIDVISDPDFIDINMLVIPGMWAPTVVNYAINAVESRGDAFYIAELTGSSSDLQAQQMQNLGYQSNYAAAYYPPCRVVDPVSRKIVTVPSSVMAAGAIAYTDRVAYPWYAPAGMERGALNADTVGFTVVDTQERLTQGERDKLYQFRVNPIASFPGEGIAIWGQKTMQIKASALDRVNVRRLLIKAKKFIASVGKSLLFEPNNANTWTRFKQLVNPFLSDIQVKNGLQQFLVVMDDTTNTPDLIDRNQMAGTIFLVPTRVAEQITIDFVVSRTGATFSQ